MSLPADVITMLLPREYNPAVVSTCRFLHDLSIVAACELYVSGRDLLRARGFGDRTDCCHEVVESRLTAALTLAARLPALVCLRIDFMPSACKRATLLMLSQLTCLTRLDLPSNRLLEKETAVYCEEKMTATRASYIQSCEETAAYLVEALARPGLTQLRWRNVSDSALESMAFLIAMTRLSHLEFHGNYQTRRHLSALAQLPQLRYFSLTAQDDNMAGGREDTVSQLPGLPLQTLLLLSYMRPLGLGWTALADAQVRVLASLTNLQHLELEDGTFAAAGIEWLTVLTALTQLHIINFNWQLPAHCLTAADVGVLTAPPTLRRLSLDDTRLAHGSCAQLTQMRQLESLQLRKQGRHHDSDAGIGFPLAALTALTCLCVARLKSWTACT